MSHNNKSKVLIFFSIKINLYSLSSAKCKNLGDISSSENSV